MKLTAISTESRVSNAPDKLLQGQWAHADKMALSICTNTPKHLIHTQVN